MENTKNNLRDYPVVNGSLSHFESCREQFGRGITPCAVGELKISDNKIVVYTLTLREGDEVVSTPLGFRRVCETDVEIYGYKVDLKKPKIMLIPKNEEEKVKSELVSVLEKDENKKLGWVTFHEGIDLSNLLK
jgi:hypothetical protein